MKRNLILTGILGLLFMGGVFIYDFSDSMDEKLTGHKWYLVENNKTYVMSFKDNNFAYTDINGKVIDEYKDCEMYHYNSNTNVVKLSCNIDKNKLVYVFMPAVAVATFVMVYIVPKFFS